MAKCRDPDIPPSEHAHAMSLREHCAVFGLEKGMISEEFLDDLGIYSTSGSVRRDCLTECRQHAFLVTHIDSIARHRELVNRRALKKAESNKDPQLKQKRADLALLKKTDEAIAKRNQREAQRALEKERWAAMGPEERKIERLNVKAAAAERKRIREHEKQLKVNAARTRLNGSNEIISDEPFVKILDENVDNSTANRVEEFNM